MTCGRATRNVYSPSAAAAECEGCKGGEGVEMERPKIKTSSQHDVCHVCVPDMTHENDASFIRNALKDNQDERTVL